MGEENKQERKIIVDEDWKARVEAEREEIRRQQAQKQATQSKGPLPPATFEALVSSFSLQAMAAMGLVPNPATGKVETDLEQARYCIDMLSMLEEKTKGNLTQQEADLLEDTLHQLRLAFVTVKSTAGRPPENQEQK